MVVQHAAKRIGTACVILGTLPPFILKRLFRRVSTSRLFTAAPSACSIAATHTTLRTFGGSMSGVMATSHQRRV